jgi:flagellar basal body-associated protein FliL
MKKNNLKIIVIVVAIVIAIAVGGFFVYQCSRSKTSGSGEDGTKKTQGAGTGSNTPENGRSRPPEQKAAEEKNDEPSVLDLAIKEIEEYFREGTNAGDFDSENNKAITGIRNEGIERLREASSNQIDEIKQRIKNDINAVKTKAEILAVKKEDALNELKKIVLEPENDYTLRQKEEWERIKKEYEDKIDNCEATENIDKELEDAKAAIKKIPTAFVLIDSNVDKTEKIGNQINEINTKLETKKDALGFWDKYLAVFIGLLLALVYIVTVILVLRLYKRKKREFEEYKDDVNKRFAETGAKSRDEYSQIKRKIDTVSEKTWNLEDKLNEKEHYTSSVFSDLKTVPGPSNTVVELLPLDEFNLWAKDPYAKALPKSFYYVKETPEIREVQEFTETSFETKWICNRRGDEKYILPNPRFFNPLTDISKFYKMDANRLQAEGQNKINITDPCIMTDKGWITYPGELEIL